LPGRVLIVDDFAVNRQLARAMLASSGYAVEEARDGEEALAAVARGRFDAVLMDCEMPVLDGYGAAAEIRRREGGGPHTPIIALTASATQADLARARAAGMDLHVAKPVTLEGLVAALDAALGLDDALQRPAASAPQIAGVLDPDRLRQLRRLYPDERALRDFAELVVGDSHARIEQLAASARAGDAAAVGPAAHALRGSCMLIGAHRVVALLTDIEARARGGEPPGEALIVALEVAHRAAQGALGESLG
jgi:CheY-like chemotaxis protein